MAQNHRHDLRSPLAKVRGLGSAKSGVQHFLVERLTGLALIPLGLWFVVSLLGNLLDGRVASLVLWLESPFVAVFLALFIIFSFVHSAFGVQVIIEDYCHHHGRRIALLLLNKTLHLVLGLLAIFAILNLHFQPPVVL
jgi:succinate dehydrogenase / fumarate reductase membrane anchor subunit